MSEIFSRRTFLKSSAALVGAAALMSLSGCDGSSKHTVTVQGFSFMDNAPDVESDNNLTLSPGSGGPNSDTSTYYDIGGGIKLSGSIGVGYAKHRKFSSNGYYPALALVLQNTNTQPLPINARQFMDAHFNGKSVAVKGLNPIASGFSETIKAPAYTDKEQGLAVVKLYLDAPDPNLSYANQSISFSFSLDGTKKVYCSGTFKDKPTFTITY